MKEKVFYNFVINKDLWYAIGYYNRYGLNNKYDNTIVELSLDEIKQLADDTIYWIENHDLMYVDIVGPDDSAPQQWITLFYMILTYKYDYDNCPIAKKIHEMDKIELCGACILTINWLKKLAKEIREPNDNDI